MTSNRSAWHIALLYMVVATLWILFSDNLLLWVGVDMAAQQRMQTAKGLLFVLVTGALLFYSMRYHLRRRQQQELILQRNEERFDLALLGSNDGVWDWDILSGELYFSDRCKLILGHPADFNMNQQETWLKHLHPEDRLSLVADLRRHLKGETERPPHSPSRRLLYLGQGAGAGRARCSGSSHADGRNCLRRDAAQTQQRAAAAGVRGLRQYQ